jgi:hypothetical protein
VLLRHILSDIVSLYTYSEPFLRTSVISNCSVERYACSNHLCRHRGRSDVSTYDKLFEQFILNLLWTCCDRCALLDLQPFPVVCEFCSVFLGDVCRYTSAWYVVGYVWLGDYIFDLCFWYASFESWPGNSLLWMRQLVGYLSLQTNTKVVPWIIRRPARPHFLPLHGAWTFWLRDSFFLVFRSNIVHGNQWRVVSG